MIELLKDVTADVNTGADEGWHRLDYGKDWILAITDTADFGGGTLAIEIRDEDSGEKLYLNGTAVDSAGSTIDLSSITGKFAPTAFVFGAGMGIRATLTGSTNPDIKGVYLYSASDE